MAARSGKKAAGLSHYRPHEVHFLPSTSSHWDPTVSPRWSGSPLLTLHVLWYPQESSHSHSPIFGVTIKLVPSIENLASPQNSLQYVIYLLIALWFMRDQRGLLSPGWVTKSHDWQGQAFVETTQLVAQVGLGFTFWVTASSDPRFPLYDSVDHRLQFNRTLLDLSFHCNCISVL